MLPRPQQPAELRKGHSTAQGSPAAPLSLHPHQPPAVEGFSELQMGQCDPCSISGAKQGCTDTSRVCISWHSPSGPLVSALLRERSGNLISDGVIEVVGVQ